MTNDLTEAIDLSTVHEGTAPEVDPHHPQRPNRRRRLAVAVAAVAVALGVGASLALGGGTDAPGSSAARPAADAPASPLATTAPATGEQPVDAAHDDGDAGAPDPAPPADPGHLEVDTTYHGLATNDFSGSFEITNDGGSDVEWSWNGDGLVDVSSSGGVLAPGESVVVEFTVAWQQLANGAFLYVSSVDTDDQSIIVTIAGTRDIVVNPEIELPEPQIADVDD